MNAPEYVVTEDWHGPDIARKWRVTRIGAARPEAYVVLTHRNVGRWGAGPHLLCSCDRPGCAHKVAVQRDLDAAARAAGACANCCENAANYGPTP